MADADPPFAVRLAPSVGSLPADEWDALGADESGGGNPFVSHAFLTAMEDSGSVGGRSGWTPAPLVIEGADGRLAGALPAYVKTHSQGEYVFDHSWADAWRRAGGDLQLGVIIAARPAPGVGRAAIITPSCRSPRPSPRQPARGY